MSQVLEEKPHWKPTAYKWDVPVVVGELPVCRRDISNENNMKM
jgi:hypothetical protein